MSLFFIFYFRIAGSSASEPVLDTEDVIDFKGEPFEVSYCKFSSNYANNITGLFKICNEYGFAL